MNDTLKGALSLTTALVPLTMPALAQTGYGYTPPITYNQTVYYPEQYGAVGNGTTDDHAALVSALSACSATGGIVQLGPKQYLNNSGNLTVPENCVLNGGLWPGNYRKTNIFNTIPYTILLNPSYTIYPLRNVGVQGVQILNSTWTNPTSLAATLTEIEGYSGTAISPCGGSEAGSGSLFQNLLIIGFTNAVNSTCGDGTYNNIFGDDTNGILNPTGGGNGGVYNSQFFPWLAEGSTWTAVSWVVASMANNGSGAVRLTITPTTVNSVPNIGFFEAPISFAASANVPTPYGALAFATGYTASNGNVQLTIIDDTHADIVGSTYSAGYNASTGTLYISPQLRTGTAFQDASASATATGTVLHNDFSFGFNQHIVAGLGSNELIVSDDRCDGPSLDTTSTCVNISSNAANVTYQGNFQSGHMTGILVNSSWTGGHHTIIAPKASSMTNHGFTNNNYYGLNMQAGSLEVLGGAIYQTIEIGTSSGNLELDGVYTTVAPVFAAASLDPLLTVNGGDFSGVAQSSTLQSGLLVAQSSAANFQFTGGATLAKLNLSGTASGTGMVVVDGQGTLFEITQTGSVAQNNYIQITSGTSAGPVGITAVGGNANISLVIAPKAGGQISLNGHIAVISGGTLAAATCGGAGTIEQGYQNLAVVESGGTSTTTCTLTPQYAWNSAPVVLFSPLSSNMASAGCYVSSYGTGSVVITCATAFTNGIFSLMEIPNT